MQREMTLAATLARAQETGQSDVDPLPFAGLSLDAAARVQALALARAARAEATAVIKTAMLADVPVAAPVFGNVVLGSTTATVSAQHVKGLEVEIAVVLSRDLEAGEVLQGGEAAVRAAIEYSVVGIELVGSRFKDRAAATPMAVLADNLSSAGYLTDLGRRWPHGTEFAGSDVELTQDGRTLFGAPARHGFGTVLASLLAYARQPFPSLPLKGGLIVTTGSLCGLVDIPGPGRIRARLGTHAFDLDVI